MVMTMGTIKNTLIFPKSLCEDSTLKNIFFIVTDSTVSPKIPTFKSKAPG